MEGSMFGKVLVDKDIAKKLREYLGEIKLLKESKDDLHLDIKKLELDKKNEMEETKHLVKLRDEKREIEFKKKEMDLEAAKAIAIASVKDDYRDKMEAQLKNETDAIKTMYAQILERLPNYNVNHSIKDKT